MGGVFSGQAVGGIFASATNIAFLGMGADAVSAAFYSFLIAVLFLATALVSFIAVTRVDFYKYYLAEEKLDDVDTKKPLEEEGDLKKKKLDEVEIKIPSKVNDLAIFYKAVREHVHCFSQVNPLRIFLQISFYASSVFLIFFVTLGCFPAITVLVESTSYSSGSEWSTKYFVPVCCFLFFNCGDWLGRFLAEKLKWPKPTKTGMLIVFGLSILRYIWQIQILRTHVRGSLGE